MDQSERRARKHTAREADGSSSASEFDAAEHLWRLLTVTNEWIRHADAKIAVSLAFTGVEMAAAASLLGDSTKLPTWVLLALGAFAMCVAGALFAGTAALIPRLVHPRNLRRANVEPNLLFFGDIAGNYQGSTDALRYASEVARLAKNASELEQSLARQIHVNSAIAMRKFWWANRTIAMTAVSAILLMTLAAAALI